MAIHDEIHIFAGQHIIVTMAFSTSLVVGAILLALRQFFRPIGLRHPKAKLPPGPKGLFLFGSLLRFRQKDNPQYMHKLLNEIASYGDMTTVHLGSKTWIFLNSKRMVSEIIAKRSSITNGRSPMPISSGIVSRDGRSLILPPSGWTERRRLMHHLLSGTALKQYGEWQELESTQMLAEYLKQPSRWYRHHYRYANSVVHRIALGERLAKSSKELEDLQNVVTFFVGSIGSSIIDWFPELAKLPKFMQIWRKHWEALGDWNERVYRSWWDPVKSQVDDGTAPPSFVRDVLLHKDTKYKGSERDAMYLAMQLIEAGSDTTREALNIFIMALLTYPECIAKARAEIDSVCGANAERLPTLADMDNLGYICAMVKEVLRWRPIFPLTPDHTALQDFEFEGYYFPAGVGFIINGIPVANECEEPEKFKPERWLDGYEKDVAHGLWQFGGGRRICVGYRLAQRGLFLNIARLLYCFNFTAKGPLDSTVLNHHMTDEPFPVGVEIRSKRHERLIVEEATKVDVLTFAEQAM
ncbi:cytochrome protein [Periconia macrospinosa]|uniref:Cytochrome protein n=1 Tax=Periconia macrospinosa TaxID=97972 RepID=A0A2V1D0Z0_9PLEO|nr:cytochrome protein [Periconia macrospinosa]